MTRLFSVVAVTLVFAYLLGGAIDQTFAGAGALTERVSSSGTSPASPRSVSASTHSAGGPVRRLERPATNGAYLLAPVVSSTGQPLASASPAEFAGSSTRAAWPTRAAMRWRAPRGWLRGAFCVHRHESVDWYRAYVDWRGYPSAYSGGMQFTLSTWRRAGGTGHPHQWRPREQVYRAYVIWDMQDHVLGNQRGDWREFGTAGRCGLR